MTKACVAVDAIWRAFGKGFAGFDRERSLYEDIAGMIESVALASVDIDTIEEDAVVGNAARRAYDMNFDSHDRAEYDVAVLMEAHILSLVDVVHYEAELLAAPEVTWGDECSSHLRKPGGPLLPNRQSRQSD